MSHPLQVWNRIARTVRRRRFTRPVVEHLEERALLAGATCDAGPTGSILVCYQVRVVPVGGALFAPNPQNPQALVETPDLTTLNVGDAYDLVLTAQSSDPTYYGVYAAYVDIAYDSSKTHVPLTETQKLTITGSGSFTLVFDGQTTQSITKVTGAAAMGNAIQSALAALPGIGPGNIEVQSQSSSEHTVRFVGKFADRDAPNMTVGPGSTANAQIVYEGDLQSGFSAHAFKEAFRSRGVRPITTIPGVDVFYFNGVSAIRQTNLLDEVGAFSDSFDMTTYPGQRTPAEAAAGILVAPPREVVRARMVADAAGSFSFTPSISSIDRPAHDTLIYVDLINNPTRSPKVAPSETNLGTPRTLTINPQIPIVAVADTATVAEDSAATPIDVLANDTTGPATGQTKNVIGVTQPAHGTVTFTATGVSYVPAANYSGSDSFTYTARNITAGAEGATATATVTVTVTPVNDAPTINEIANPTAILEDAAAQTVGLSGISAGPDETQVISVTATSDNPDLTGTVGVTYTSPGTEGSLSFTPAANKSGTANITVTVKDDGGTEGNGSDTTVRTFTVTVLAANDAPSFVKGPGQDTHDEAGAVQVAGWATAISAGAPNESGQQLSFTVTADMPNLFSVPPAIDASGTLTYTPALNASGDAVVTVVLRDNGGIENGGVDASAAQTFAIHVVKLRPMHNAAKPLDASGDNAISAADPLACINHLNAFGSGPVSEAPEGMGFLDVNADGFVSSADPLAVINHINAFGTESDAPEGEAAIGSALTQIEWAAGSSAATSDDLSGVIAMLALDSGRAATRRRGRA